jgi:hypothetical protein
MNVADEAALRRARVCARERAANRGKQTLDLRLHTSQKSCHRKRDKSQKQRVFHHILTFLVVPKAPNTP